MLTLWGHSARPMDQFAASGVSSARADDGEHEAMNKGFVYESENADYPIVAVIFDSEGFVVRAQVVDTVDEGDKFVRDVLIELRELERHTNPL